PPPGAEFWRAPTLQQPSNFRGLAKSGQVVYGIVLSYPSVHVAKTLAATGADWCWIDAEHVAWSPTLLVEVIQVIIQESGGKMIPVVRVPSKTAFEYMSWCLDAGAGGIIVPHMETEEEVAAVVAACRFPPLGHRSFPPFTFIPGVTDITPEGETPFSLANKHVAIIPQIESRVGVNNIKAIIKNDQVDMIMIGSGDLRMDMGLSGFMGSEPEYIEACERVTSVARASNTPLMCIAFGEHMIKPRLDQGYRVIGVSTDLMTLAYG
ncbi:Pyruvate/Phosphoenolpyruvate kinase-like domain-containing protein, partial [Mycena vulgaris]